MFKLFLLIFLSLLRLEASEKIRHVYLTYSHDPTSSVVVNIHGIQTPPELIVYYDEEKHHNQIRHYKQGIYGKGKKEEGLPENRKIYHIELTDLKPNSIYYVTIGDRLNAFSEEFSFRTLPLESPLLLIEGGDWENTQASEKLAKKAASMRPHAILLGGDYPSRAISKLDYQQWDYWLDIYTKTMRTPEGCLIPMIMAIGNHEVAGGFGKTIAEVPFFLTYFTQSSLSYFSLPLGAERHLFVLDSGHISAHDGEQKKWLQNELKKNAHKKIKLALYHVPLYPSIRFYKKSFFYYVSYGFLELFRNKSNADKLFSKESAEGRNHWKPLFDAYNMTVAFEHHDHTLKRTKLLKNNHVHPKGTLYLGDGGFGSEYQHYPLQALFQSHFECIMGKKHFFWAVLIQKNKISYAAVTADGEILDQFVQLIEE